MAPRSIAWTDRSHTGDRSWPHACALLLVLALVQVPRFVPDVAAVLHSVFPSDRGYIDFDHAYYPAAQAIRTDPTQLYGGAAYDPATGTLALHRPAHFVNVPIVAWLFVPLTTLPLATAGRVLLAINVLVAVICLVLIQQRLRGYPPLLRWGVTLAFASSGPLLYGLSLGQTSALVLLLLLLADRALVRGADTTAGVWLGLAGLIKIPVLLLFPYLLLRRRWRTVSAGAAAMGALTVTSLLAYGWALHADYFNLAIRAQWGTSLAAYNCQSLDATITRLATSASLLSWQPLTLTGVAAWVKHILIGGVVVATGGVLVRSSRASHPRALVEMVTVISVALLILPITWVHYGIWGLPAMAVLGACLLPPGSRGLGRHQWAVGALALAGVLINVPVPPPWVVEHWQHAWWFRAVMSHQAVGMLVLLALCFWALEHELPGQVRL